MYPTRRQILRRPLRHRRATVALVREWKRTYRGRRRSEDAIRALLTGLATLYEKPVRVEFADGYLFGDHYDRGTSTIRLVASRVSIVTALHEFGHHLFGSSELKACRWSVWLFRRTFRRTYARCTWRGHMLVVNNNVTN